MSREIYIGDVIRTKDGVGVVRDVRTWRDRIEDMEDWQAAEFSSTCNSAVGPGFREEWIELLVVIDGKPARYLWADVEVLESRDGKSNKSFRVSKGRRKV